METVENIPEDLKGRLDGLIGNTWMYNGRLVEVKGISRDNGQIRVINGGHTIAFAPEEAGKKIKEFLPVEEGHPSVVGDRQLAIQVFQKDSTQMESLEKLILENIKEVQKNPAFVPQAKVKIGRAHV